MSINIDQALQTFIAEARELLEDMEKSLLRLESEPEDAETIGAIFRAAHTIKGSAGLFGLDPVVSFTHIVENVLDRVRDGAVPIEGNLVAVLLECCDHMLLLVNIIADQGGQLDEATLARESDLRQRLTVYQDVPQSRAAVLVEPELESSGGVVEGADNWHISLRFGRDVLRNGMDPISFLRYLATLGEIIAITTLPDAMPEAAGMDPESCYLGFEINFKSDADKNTIAGVFEFAQESSTICILPPHSKVAEYIQLISGLPESEKRLGDILVATGALTQRELEDGLSVQQKNAHPDGSTPPLGKILWNSTLWNRKWCRRRSTSKLSRASPKQRKTVTYACMQTSWMN